MTLTQRQLPTDFEPTNEDGCWEHSVCPFCEHDTYAIYLGQSEVEYLQIVDFCHHYMGLVSGSMGMPLMMYQGYSEDLERN